MSRSPSYSTERFAAREALKDDNFTLAASIYSGIGEHCAAFACIKAIADIRADEERDAADPIYQRFMSGFPREKRNAR